MTDIAADQPPPAQQARWARFTARATARWARFTTALPMGLALTVVAAVWAFGAVWSFTEQSAFAQAKGFSDPALLPLVLDGLAVAMAGVAFAASLDGRPAVAARFGTALAVAGSAASNGVWAAERSVGSFGPGTTGRLGPDLTTVAIGASVPIAANIAFEVFLAELRRQVQRRRGMPAPVALPSLRLIRLILAVRSTFTEWRDEVLARTAQTHLDPAHWGGSEEVTHAPPAAPPPTPSTAPVPLEDEPAAGDDSDNGRTGDADYRLIAPHELTRAQAQAEARRLTARGHRVTQSGKNLGQLKGDVRDARRLLGEEPVA